MATKSQELGVTHSNHDHTKILQLTLHGMMPWNVRAAPSSSTAEWREHHGVDITIQVAVIEALGRIP